MTPIRVVVLCVVSAVSAVAVSVLMRWVGLGEHAVIGGGVGGGIAASAMLAVWVSQTDEDEDELAEDLGGAGATLY